MMITPLDILHVSPLAVFIALAVTVVVIAVEDLMGR
jgi:hypothetical protein